jgi:5-oxoprolinase (ATP-hydrolysing) subunit A
MQIDLNSDLGESFGAWRMGDDTALLQVVSSANVACGFHAGDPAGILETLRAAAEFGVNVGAHVSYPDLVGFGRREMQVASADLRADVIYQIAALTGLARVAGVRVSYVKPHGALYNTIARDERQARDVTEAILAFDPQLALVALAGSPLVGWGSAAGLRVVQEAFADRAYRSDGTLVPRGQAGAVLHDADLVASRMVRMVKEGQVEAIDGTLVPLKADSICVHGDTPGAVAMAQRVKEALHQTGVEVGAFSIARGAARSG